MMNDCDDRQHHSYAARLVERWNRKGEWCASFSANGEEAVEMTNNFCESAFRYVYVIVCNVYNVMNAKQSNAGNHSR